MDGAAGAGLMGAVVSLPVAFLVFRLRGHYFAIGTWVVAEVFLLGFAQIKSLGGGSGMSLPISAIRSIAASRADREFAVYWWLSPWPSWRSRGSISCSSRGTASP